MDAAAPAERLGEANPLAVMNWFSGHDVPDFEQADRLATYPLFRTLAEIRRGTPVRVRFAATP